MAATASGEPSQFEFRIRGRLDRRWERWFEGMTLVHEDDGTTTLRGSVIDQSALHGVLGRLRDVGATLISVHPVDDVVGEPASDGPDRDEGRRTR
jgi:hypothetical protein